MRIKENLSTVANVLVITVVAYALLRPEGAVGAAVIRKYQDVVRRRTVAREWSTIAAVRRVDVRNTPTAFVEFADYECPACRRQYQALHATLNSPLAGGLGFRHLPLPIHKHAEGAARTAICAEQQGKFAEMHNRLFTTDAWLTDTNWLREAKAVGIKDTASFRTCLSSESATEALRADMSLADSLKIEATPTFVAARDVHIGFIPDTMYLRLSGRMSR